MSVRVLFDESHSEAWSTRPEVARAMQPAHPADASYAQAAELAGRRGLHLSAHTEGALDRATLEHADVLVIAHPSDTRYERTVGGDPTFGDDELDAIETWVRGGGGLVVLGETEQDKYETNIGDLLERFGVRVVHDTVQDYEHAHLDVPTWVRGDLGRGTRGPGGDLLARVAGAAFYRAGTIDAQGAADAQILARTSATASSPRAPLAVALEAGAGRVAVLADSDLFGDDCLEDLDHGELWCNLLFWVAGAAFGAPARATASPIAADPAWVLLRDHTDALGLLQAPDGSVDVGHRAAASEHVAAMAEAVTRLAVHVPHDAAYLEAAAADLHAWAAGGFGRPDFTRALELLRPDRTRADGVEHVVLLPMYLQNSGSRDVRFEAIVVRVPWPAWLARLEAERYDNAKFVPVTFVDHTAGYASECAVLFPETVAVAGPPANHFGAIFCDREAERFRRVVHAAAELTSVNLPPDAAALLRSAALSEEAFVLWDLVHDRTHSHGDLPFDPFMIRQRLPYWMYALEELRCDLTAFSEAVALERGGDGVPQARYAQYAILFDRLFRFPVTGARVRNYDGLGGQLLFAYLHRHGHVHWTDNQLTVEWATVADGVRALKAEVEELYREGIDRSKLAQWGAVHDLVARYVRPAEGSRWTAGVRAFADVEDPRPYLDAVLADEFPLSMFYVQLKDKLAPALVRQAPSLATVAA